MKKESTHIDSRPRTGSQITRTIHVPRPDDDVGDPEVLAILGYEFVLFDLCKAISLAPERRLRFNRRRFIQQPSLRLMRVTVHREGTDIDEAAQAPVRERC